MVQPHSSFRLHRINVLNAAEKVQIVGGMEGKPQKVRAKPQKRGGRGVNETDFL